MRCTHALFLVAVFSFAHAGLAFALPPDKAPPVANAPSRPPPPPPPPPENDPLLEPIAPAPHTVATWDEAIATLRARSTDLRIALDEIERTDGVWRQTLAASLPTLVGTGNVTLNLLRGRPCTVAGNCSQVLAPDLLTFGAGITLMQPLLAPQAWHAARTAKLGTEVAQLTVEEQKRLLTIALSTAVVAVVASERIGEINRGALRAALDRLALCKRRVTLGGGISLDSVRAEQDVSTVRSAVVTGNEVIRKARDALGFALGSTEAWGVPPGIDLNGVEASAHASCEAAGAIEERADVAAARRASDIAKRNVDNVKLGLSPTIDLVSTLGVATSFGDRPQRFASGLHENWTIAGVLTVPFYDGGARYGATRSTTALADQSVQVVEATRRLASLQITQARRSVEVAEQSRHVAENARELARETDRLARIAFQVGSGTSLDLVEAGRRLREAEIQLALQEFALVQAKISALLTLSRCRW